MTATETVHILIDTPEDGTVEEYAWVKVTTVTPSPDAALAKLESDFPAEEMGGGGECMAYVHVGEERMAPVNGEDRFEPRFDGDLYYKFQLDESACDRG